MLGVFLLSLLAAFFGAIVPGPLFALTLNQALLVGWSAGFWLIVGHMLVELALLGALRLGLGGLLQRPVVTRAIGLVGGLVLCYFAWGMLATGFSGHLATRDARAPAMSIGMLVGQGALMSVANPYWELWWATVGIGLIASQTARFGARAWSVFFLGHTLADFLWYMAVSTLTALGGTFLSPAMHLGLIAVCGFGVAVLGIVFIARQLWTPARTD